jgi:hypothetical protein
MARDVFLESGATTRRSDFDCLLFSLLACWFGRLPWDGITETERLRIIRDEGFENQNAFFDDLESSHTAAPPFIKSLMAAIGEMEPETIPDYAALKRLIGDYDLSVATDYFQVIFLFENNLIIVLYVYYYSTFFKGCQNQKNSFFLFETRFQLNFFKSKSSILNYFILESRQKNQNFEFY